MVQKIIRKDRHSALYIHCICIFIIRKTNSQSNEPETSMIWLNDQYRKPRETCRPAGTHPVPAAVVPPALRSREAPVTGQVHWAGLPFLPKTKCPVFSQMHLEHLRLFKDNNNKNPATAAFLLILASHVFYSVTSLSPSLDSVL